MSKFYAVKKGHTIGVFTNVEDFNKSLKAYKNSEGRVFSDLKKAKAYIKPKKKKIKKTTEIHNDLLEFSLKNKEALAFTDGSFNEITKEYSFGCVYFSNENGYEEFYKKYKKDNYSKYANMAGEYAAVVFAIKKAISDHMNCINIYHDASDIAYYTDPENKIKSDLNKKYNQFVNEAKKKITINFIKVKAHSNSYYNKRADKLANMAMKLQIEEIHPLDENLLNTKHLDLIKTYLPQSLETEIAKQKEKITNLLNSNYKIDDKISLEDETNKLNDLMELLSLLK